MLSLDPGYPTALERLLLCTNRLHRFADTVAFGAGPLAEDSESPGVHLALAVAHRNLGDLAHARESLERSLELRPDPKLLALRRAWESA